METEVDYAAIHTKFAAAYSFDYKKAIKVTRDLDAPLTSTKFNELMVAAGYEQSRVAGQRFWTKPQPASPDVIVQVPPQVIVVATPAVCTCTAHHRKCSTCDPDGRLVRKVRSTTHRAVKGGNADLMIMHVGCTAGQLRIHLESNFQPGMTWDNYGPVWHIDHIIPIKYKHDGQTPSHNDIINRLHWTNLQPMYAKENIAKGNHYVG